MLSDPLEGITALVFTFSDHFDVIGDPKKQEIFDIG